MSEIFEKSFSDYKKNFKITSISFLLFKLLPILIIMPILFFYVIIPQSELIVDLTEFIIEKTESLSNQEFSQNIGSLASMTGSAISEAGQESEILLGIMPYIYQIIFLYIKAIPLYILSFIFSMFFLIILYYVAFNNKDGKLKFKDAFKNSLNYFWKVLGLLLLIGFIFLLISIGLVLAIIILAITIIGTLLIPFLFIGFFVLLIYLAVIWVFSIYFIFDEKSGIFESLRKSKELVKGNFWRVLGYIALIVLISIGVYIILLILGMFVGLIYDAVSPPPISIEEITSLENFDLRILKELVIRESLKSMIVKNILALISAILLTPFVIFFFKNLYLRLKSEKKSSNKKKSKVT